MLVVLTERVAQVLDWMKNLSGYNVVESNWKMLNTSQAPRNNDRPSLDGYKRGAASSSISRSHSASMLADWILLDGSKVSYLSGNSKEDLCRSLESSNGQDVFVMSMSYSDAQLPSTCRVTHKDTNYSIARCRSYRLRKNHLMTDPRDTLSSIAKRSDELRTLFFSRHGESEYNVLGKVGGDADLSPRGYLYADTLAEYINNTLSHAPGFRIWTSCMKRTIQTARKIKAPQEHLDALNELNTGVCDGLTYEEIAERYPVEFAARDHDKFHYRYPEGESYHDLLLRVRPILDRLENENNVLVVAHQAVLRCLLAALLNKENVELPYVYTPLHTVMKLSIKPATGDSHLELIPLSIECVNTHRAKPENCSQTRTAEEALVTLPAHF